MRRLAIVLLLLTACSQKADPKKTLQSVRSWSATLALVSRALGQGTVPRNYSMQVARAAESDLARALQDSDQPAVREECTRALESARRLRVAAERR